MVTFPTRHDTNGTANTLYLLLTSHPSLVSDVIPDAGLSDHCIVKAKISTKTKLNQKPPREIPLWKKVDHADFKAKAADLKTEYSNRDPVNQSVEKNWTWFRDAICNLVYDIVPHKLVKGRMRTPWFTTQLKRLCNKKERLYKRAKKSGLKTDWEKFIRVRKSTDRAIRSSHRRHVNNILNTENPKDFWRYIRYKRKDNTGVQSLKVDDKLYTDDQDKAEALSNQFESVFTHEDPSLDSYSLLPPSPFPDMPPIIMRSDGIRKLLLTLDVSKAIIMW